jgi:hypothetical protein
MSKESSLRSWERSLSPKVDAKPRNLTFVVLKPIKLHVAPTS